jgi:hypothetical protein
MPELSLNKTNIFQAKADFLSCRLESKLLKEFQRRASTADFLNNYPLLATQSVYRETKNSA